MSKIEVKVILPERSQDLISNDLRKLTKAICKKTGADGSGGLGGEYGYGVNYENDIFMFHPYCWCEKDDCPWCGGCDCPETAFHYFIDGKPIDYEEYCQIFTDTGYEALQDTKYGTAEYLDAKVAFDRKIKIRNQRCSQTKDDICDFCRHEGIFKKFGSNPHGQSAPNFWYKPTNFQVWWYKWIGRDMRYSRKITEKQWTDIFKECIKSLKEE
jgi:hypothetical protein